jgi:hypothetical protein
MTSERYRRLHAACLAMAQQSDLPEIQARWLRLAEAWFNVATGVDDTKPSSRHPGQSRRSPRTADDASRLGYR